MPTSAAAQPSVSGSPAASSASSASPAMESSVVTIRTVFDVSVHEYQFSRRSAIFSSLQQLIAARYPLTQLYLHFLDEDGDRCRITTEAELREALRVCGQQLTIILSSSLPALRAEIASPTQLAAASPSPSVSTISPSPQPLLSAAVGEQEEEAEQYLSSDEEEVWEQARSQVRLTEERSRGSSAEREREAEDELSEFGIVALDSEDEKEDLTQSQQQPPPAAVPVPIPVFSHEAEPVVVAAAAAAPLAGEVALVDGQEAAAQEAVNAEAEPLAAVVEVKEDANASSEPAAAAAAAASSEAEMVATAVNARLRAFYSVGGPRESEAAVAAARTALPQLLAAFFSDPAVARIISESESLSPLLHSSFPLFLHQLSVCNPALASHPLLRYTFSLSALHAGTVCDGCGAAPIVGQRFGCTDCGVSVCSVCHAACKHDTTHALLPMALPAYDAEAAKAELKAAEEEEKSGELPAASSPRSRRLLSERVLQGGRRVWSGMEERLEKVDRVLSQFTADLKKMIEEMMDGVFPPPVPFTAASPFAAASCSSSSPVPAALSPRRASSQVEKKEKEEKSCDVRRLCNSPASPRSPQLQQSAVPAVPQSPRRQRMEPQPAVAAAALPAAPAASEWMSELELISEMGLIHSSVDEETVRELLQASRGDVAQCVQWMADRLEMA